MAKIKKPLSKYLSNFCFFIILALFSINSLNSWALDKTNQNHSKRNYISIVGSSTVYPFTAVIAEKFGRKKNYKTPTVEATGTGGGFKLFCSGIGYKYPDLTNASRPIQQSEIRHCQENGVTEISEIKIGYDGIVIANSSKGKNFNLTKKHIFLALAQKVPQNKKLVDNFYKKWSQIDESLPNIEIKVYGPPPSSGTRDAFVELAMEEFCMNNDTFINEFNDKKIRQKKCHTIRSDGHYVEAGENDNLILQKLRNDENALGIFGFSFFEENKNFIKVAKINFIEPNFENIINGQYPVSRPLFIYFKKQNFGLIADLEEFVRTILSSDTIGKDGYLVQKGLIPLSDLELRMIRDKVLRGL